MHLTVKFVQTSAAILLFSLASVNGRLHPDGWNDMSPSLSRSLRRSLPPLTARLHDMQRSLPRDIRAFLENYSENDEDDKSIRANLEFYSNKRRCQPDGVLVNEIHER